MKSLALFQCSTTFKPRKDRLSGAAELGERLVGRVLDKCQVEPTLEKIAALPEELGESAGYAKLSRGARHFSDISRVGPGPTNDGKWSDSSPNHRAASSIGHTILRRA